MPRIHILGAAGSGTTTLGAALALRLGLTHADADDFLWLPTDPPFTTLRRPEDRRALLIQHLPADRDWVFSGAATRWATPLEPLYTHIVFLHLDPAVRMDRLRRREAQRHGRRILPGGDMAARHTAFVAWAAAYDTADSVRRGRVAHEAWLADQVTPVLRLNSARPLQDLVGAVLARL